MDCAEICVEFCVGIFMNLRVKIMGKLFIFLCIFSFMAGQRSNYYYRTGKGKNKRYHCEFESCNHHVVKKLSSIYSHIERTHGAEIERARKIRQEKKRREEAFKELETEFFIIEETPEEAREREKKEKLEIERQKEQRQKEERRKIEMWNKMQKEIEDEKIRKGISQFWFFSKVCGIELSDETLNFMASELLKIY